MEEIIILIKMNQESNNNLAKAKMKAVVCGHCGKELMVKMPSKPGRYKFTCPQCASKVSFEVKLPDGGPVLKVLKSGVLDDRVISRQAPKVAKKTPALPEDESLEAATTQRRSPAIANIPVLGMPKKSAGKDKQYYMVEKAQVNKRYRIVCPECGKDLLIMSRSADKYNMIKCSICGTQVFYKSVSKVSVPQERSDKAQQAPEDARKTPPPPPPVQVAEEYQQGYQEPHYYGHCRLFLHYAKTQYAVVYHQPTVALAWKVAAQEE